jgi:hypothetical protein
MASFTKGGAGPDTFGKNVYLRSTDPKPRKESYTVSAAAVALETVNGVADQKVLQSGEVMAKITSGPEAGKIGPYDTDTGVTDGREDKDNIVGINDTFLPWQLLERDVEVAVTYEAAVVQGWCFERDAGVRVVLTDATAAEMVAKKGLDLKFK